MLKSLVKIRLQGLFFRSLKTAKKESPSFGKIIFMLLIIGYVAVVFGLMFGVMFNEILKPFNITVKNDGTGYAYVTEDKNVYIVSYSSDEVNINVSYTNIGE